MEIIMRVDFGLIVGVICALVLFGAGYNQVIALSERRGWLEGFSSLAVAVGSVITLCGIAVISLPAALLALVCFAASGIPMIAGSLARYVRARELERQRLIQEAKHANDPAGMA